MISLNFLKILYIIEKKTGIFPAWVLKIRGENPHLQVRIGAHECNHCSDLDISKQCTL